MTEINLLPWRERKREQDKKLFMVMISAGVGIAILLVFLINYYASNLVSYQTARNQILETEIKTLDDKIKEIKALKLVREGLISRMSIVQNLQSTRTLMVHLFDELIKVMPSGVYVTTLERKNDVVSVEGFAESNTGVSLLMTSIENDVWIQTPTLSQIKKVEDKKDAAADSEFKLSFVLKPKN